MAFETMNETSMTSGWKTPRGGETGALLAAFDWSATSLGARDSWPAHLAVIVDSVINSPVPKVLMWGPRHVMIYNDGYMRIAGGNHPEAFGATVPLIWPEIWDFNRRILEAGFRGEVQSFRDQLMVLHRHGAPEDVYFDLFYTPIFDAADRVDGVLCTVIENTDRVRAQAELGRHAEALEREIRHRQRAEDQLRQLNETLESRIIQALDERRQTQAALEQAQKMEAIGKLTGGVAHDFNNLLQVISGNLQLLAKDLQGNPRAEARIGNALAGVSRGSRLASQLLAFGRRQALEPKVVNVTRFVREMDDILRHAIGDGIRIETVVGGGLWNTFIDPIQIESALLNLALNARDAMNGQGQLTIELGNASLDDRYADSNDGAVPGQYVMLAVSDTGAGMAPEILEKAFEPFFSTKAEGKGSGLGLSMVYGFVRQSGGHVKIYSEPGHGTTVRLYLPRALEAEDQEVSVDGGPVSGGTETVLVVEDDDAVRATVVEMLTDLGYRVLKAVDADSALHVLESGIPIDILFTDVVMPGKLKSPELARKARERLPGIAVLFTSGYTENSIVHGGRLDSGVSLLSKPYTREALARKFRSVLAKGPGQPGAAPIKAPPIVPEIAAAPAAAVGARLSVMLVEDDGLIRMNTADMLADLGYAVVEAGSAEEAMAALLATPVDVLVTDVNLPGMSGPALARKALDHQPELGIVFATGDRHVAGIDALAPARVTILGKPYDMDGLEKAVETVAARAVVSG